MTRGRVVGVSAVALLAVGMFPVVSTQPGAHAISVTQAFLLFYSGVFSLVAFTAAVVWGLIAAERFVPVRYRVLAQGVHRMFGLLGIGFLGTHIVLQILAEHAQALDAVVPFLDTRDRLVATGLGTIAADLMIVVYSVGKVRGRFVNASRPWVWRIVHGIAYLSWPLAIAHGLTAGRPVKGSWVTISYVVCLGVVVLALLIRLISPFPAVRAAQRVPSEGTAWPDRPKRPERAGAERPPAKRPRQPARPSETGPLPEPAVPSRRIASPPEAAPPFEPAQAAEYGRPVMDPRPSGPMPRVDPRPSGPMPRVDPRPSGPMPRVDPRPSGPMPRVDPRPSGPMPRVDPRPSGPMPRVDPRPSGPMPVRDPHPSGPLPVTDPHPSGPLPVTDPHPSGPLPAVGRPAGRQAAAEPQRGRLLIPDRSDEERPSRDWLDAVERFPLFRRRSGRTPSVRRIVEPDLEEVEFWANLRAETAVWIRRGRR